MKTKKALKVAILGTDPDWKNAPFKDRDWEIWVCNRAGLKMEPFNRIFEIHKNWDYENPEAKEKYLADLAATYREVISIVPIPGVISTVIDRDAYFKKYGSIWFSSSFGYMIAHALEIGAEEIGFWGVQFESREEVITQFMGVRHFIEVAKIKGIKVHIPDRAWLQREPIPYADRFETPLAMYLESKAAIGDSLVRRAAQNARIDAENYWYTRGRLAEMAITDKYYDALLEKSEAQAQRMEEARDRLSRIKGELWAIQQVRRMFVFNAMEPELYEDSAIDAENSGPV